MYENILKWFNKGRKNKKYKNYIFNLYGKYYPGIMQSHVLYVFV